MAERFKKNPQLLQNTFKSGGGDTARVLSSELKKFSERAGKERVEQVVREESTEGAKKGSERDEKGNLIGQPRKSNFSLGDQAFNKSLVAAYSASLDNDNRIELNRLVEQNPTDIIGFNKSVKSYRDTVVDNVPEEMQQGIAQSLDRQVATAQTTVESNVIRKQKAEVQTELITAASSSADEASVLADKGNLEEAKIELKKANVAIDATDLTLAQKKQWKAEKKMQMVTQKWIHLADVQYGKNTGNIAGDRERVQAWLDENETIPKDGMTSDEWKVITVRMEQEMNRKFARVDATSAASRKRLNTRMTDYERALQRGMRINKDDEELLSSEVQASGDPELIKWKNRVDTTATAALLSKAERESIIAQPHSGWIDDVDQQIAFENMNAAVNKLYQEDGYTMAVHQELIPPPPPLDFNNPDSFQIRKDNAAIVSEHSGYPTSPLTDPEAESLAVSLETATVNEKVQYANLFQDSPVLWEQLDKKNAGTFAMASATKDPVVMRTIFQGQDNLKSGQSKPLKADEYRQYFSDYVGGIYGSRDYKTTLDASLAFYAAASSDSVSGIYNESDFEAAVNAVTGGIAKYNGTKIELPRGVPLDNFEDFIDEMQPETIRELGGAAHFSDEEVISAMQNNQIVSMGGGSYTLRNGGLTIMSEEDPTKPFIFSYDVDTAMLNNARFLSKALQNQAPYLLKDKIKLAKAKKKAK